MLRIHQAIQSGRYPNAVTLAAELEVSTKSIHRDLEFMRDRLELPLEYSAARNGYHYTEEVGTFPTLQITEGELFALLVAEKALQQYRGTTFERPLLSAFKKMAASLPDTVSLNLADWEQTISFRTRRRADPESGDFRRPGQGRRPAPPIATDLSQTRPARRPKLRVVDPYHLANINGEWFLFAWCHLRQDIRTFVPARIQAVEPPARPLPARKNSPSKSACATVLACNPARASSRSSSISTNWWPITSARRNGMNPRNCASWRTAGWNCA